MWMVDVDDSCQFSADSQPKSTGLVWGSAAIKLTHISFWAHLVSYRIVLWNRVKQCLVSLALQTAVVSRQWHSAIIGLLKFAIQPSSSHISINWFVEAGDNPASATVPGLATWSLIFRSVRLRKRTFGANWRWFLQCRQKQTCVVSI